MYSARQQDGGWLAACAGAVQTRAGGRPEKAELDEVGEAARLPAGVAQAPERRPDTWQDNPLPTSSHFGLRPGSKRGLFQSQAGCSFLLLQFRQCAVQRR